ncbi:MAG: hypothetical protein H7644_07915 [Candidatus Heimdallarchaeota archaeon]|nr:hypothetical protein [Candidatus Heimdallarchaeota archaeon]
MKKLADKRKIFRMSFFEMHFISKIILLLCIPFVSVIALLSALEEWFHLDFFGNLGFWFWSIVIGISVAIVVNLALEHTRQKKLLKEIPTYSTEEEVNESLEKEVQLSSEQIAQSNLKDKCSVCMDSIRKDDKYVTCPSCKIPAHTSHLVEWLKIKSVCPNCNKKIQGI